MTLAYLKEFGRVEAHWVIVCQGSNPEGIFHGEVDIWISPKRFPPSQWHEVSLLGRIW